MRLNLGYPNFFYGATTLYFYRTSDYKQALGEARKYDMTGLFWGLLPRAAVLGQLGRKEEAGPELDQL